jgi:hypothetical protein
VEEIWRSVEGWEDLYEVSNLGRVRRNGRILNGTFTGKGQQIWLSCPGYKTRAYIHRLVAEAFLGPCPSRGEVIHKNNDLFDNGVENLRWRTPDRTQRSLVSPPAR